jgi:hypothetical protein
MHLSRRTSLYGVASAGTLSPLQPAAQAGWATDSLYSGAGSLRGMRENSGAATYLTGSNSICLEG